MKQRIEIIGRVGRDAEMRYTPTGQAVTNFPVATNEKYTNNNGEQIKKTVWFRVTCWGKQAETCNQYVKKGMLISVEGKLTADPEGNPRVWNDTAGNPHANFELTATNVLFLSRSEQSAVETAQELAGEPEGDLPF